MSRHVLGLWPSCGATSSTSRPLVDKEAREATPKIAGNRVLGQPHRDRRRLEDALPPVVPVVARPLAEHELVVAGPAAADATVSGARISATCGAKVATPTSDPRATILTPALAGRQTSLSYRSPRDVSGWCGLEDQPGSFVAFARFPGASPPLPLPGPRVRITETADNWARLLAGTRRLTAQPRTARAVRPGCPSGHAAEVGSRMAVGPRRTLISDESSSRPRPARRPVR
jgi:hypothetical protein